MERTLYPSAAGSVSFVGPDVPLALGEGDYDSAIGPTSSRQQPTVRFTAFDERAGLLMEDVPERKWYRRLGTLKQWPRPPIPEERRVSREHTASILSVLTFQWIAPLMKVGPYSVIALLRFGLLITHCCRLVMRALLN
jgi:hypothetical protein